MSKQNFNGFSLSGLFRGFLVVSLVFGLSTTNALAADMTVEQVIGMHKAGLPAALIKQTIQSTGAKFSLSVSDVKKLKKAGVAQSVIDAMSSTGSSGHPRQSLHQRRREPDELQSLRPGAEEARIKEEARIRDASRL